MSKSRIKALLVAINEYPILEHQLSGCVRDLDSLKEFLEQRFNSSNYDLDIKVLINQEATRQNIIDQFLARFAELEDSDVGLFYFSGHGSSSPAPSAFHHNTPNQNHESLVCFDSRVNGGKDLLDKEISWLIWKVTQNKKINFTGIIDSCHSGSIFRKIDKAKITTAKAQPTTPSAIPQGARMLQHRNAEQAPWKKYLGAEDYLNQEGNISVPTGNYTLFSACRNDEFAFEKIIHGKSRGIFTHCLLQALKVGNGNISTAALQLKTKAQIYQLSDLQHPQFQTTNRNLANGSVLGGILKNKARSIVVFHDKNKGWIINLGALHGIYANTTKLNVFKSHCTENDLNEVKNIARSVSIKNVYPVYSCLTEMESFDKSKQYYALLQNSYETNYKELQLKNDSSWTIERIQKEIENFSGYSFDFTKTKSNGQLKLRLHDRGYTLVNNESGSNLIDIASIPSQNLFPSLAYNLGNILRWKNIHQLENPISNLSSHFFNFEFYEVLKTTNSVKNEVELNLLDLSQEICLTYGLSQTNNERTYEQREPKFKFKIENTYSRPYWFSALYLSSDYSISNELLPKIKLNPGEHCWLEHTNLDDYRSPIIPVHLPNHLQEKGILEIVDFLKIMISSEEFETNSLNQEGLNFTIFRQSKSKTLGREKKARTTNIADWISITVPIRIQMLQRTS